MPFVQGKCESCGGILTVDPSLKAAICPFCGSAYVVQDSINYYNTTIKVETMHADVVNISDESSSEGRLKAADAYMKINKFELAEEEYKKASALTPQNYLCWLGLIESHTLKYKKRIKSSSEIRKLDDYAKSVLAFAPSESSDTILCEYNEYIANEANKNAEEITETTELLASYNTKYEELDSQSKALFALIDQKLGTSEELQNRLDADKKNQATAKLFVLWFVLFLPSFMFLVLSRFSGSVILAIGIVLLALSTIPIFLAIKKYIQNNNYKKTIASLKKERKQLRNQIKDISTQIDELLSEKDKVEFSLRYYE